MVVVSARVQHGPCPGYRLLLPDTSNTPGSRVQTRVKGQEQEAGGLADRQRSHLEVWRFREAVQVRATAWPRGQAWGLSPWKSPAVGAEL